MNKNSKTLLITVTIFSMILLSCSRNESVNLSIEEYKIQNENLQSKIKKLEEAIQNYKDSEASQIKGETGNKSYFGENDILHVKELNGTYFIVMDVSKDETSSVELWKYNGKSFAELLAEGIYINIEIRDPYFYCTVTKYIGKDEYKEEVVKFDSEGNKIIIYEGKNVEISASPNGEYFIIIENPYFSDRNLESIRTLKILDKNDKVVFDKVIDSKMDTDLEPYGWNDNEFWAVFRYAAGIPEILILNADTHEFKVKENKADYNELDINMKNGWIFYSDFPLFYDIDTYNDFKQSKRDVRLYLYNIFTDEKILIATSISKEFLPEWIDEYTFEYFDPNSIQRLRYTLKSER
ncbi:MAG: hypothetical protein K0R54_4578 [Clostridiaceae bacterium]|nr:hypothetical protein [Clostridiaceae bacterium]